MLPKILTSKRKAHIPQRETPLSRRYLRIMEKWIPVGLEYFNDWPDRPNSGHFFGGCYWYGIETVGPALVFASVASAPQYDPNVTGCTRKELKEIALKALRYLCFTHDSGPLDCIRPEVGIAGRKWGTKWGERGAGFFRESQCGTTVAGMGVIARLLGNMVDDQTWRLLTNVHKDYASRFGTMNPKSGVYTNTQMEENGWTSCGLASVELFLSNSSENATWAETARRWMFCTTTTQQDTKNHGQFDEKHTVRQLTGEIFTTLPDYMAENHGMVHPIYTWESMKFLGMLGVIYKLGGDKLPPHALHNRNKIYDQLKRATDRCGYVHPVQGMDWPYHFTDPGSPGLGAAACILKDPEGAYFERKLIQNLEARQDGNKGRMLDRKLSETVHGIQDPLIMREPLFVTYPAYSYLLHRIYGDGVKPTPGPSAERKLRGVRVFPHSGFVLQRHRTGITSFSWRNSIMALPVNKDGIQTIGPATDSFLGRIVVRNRPDSHDLEAINIDQRKGSFAAALITKRAQGSVRQEVLFAGLPSGISLSMERFTALESITVERVDQGCLRVINENFGALKGNCHGYRDFHTPDTTERFEGYASTDPDSDIIHSYEHPEWVNVDGRVGFVFNGSGKTIYHNRHYFRPWWAVADDLTLSRIDKPFRAIAGQEISRLTALIAPDRSRQKTADLPFTVLTGKRSSVGLIADGYLVAGNFESSARTVALKTARIRNCEIPVFVGETAVDSKAITYRMALESRAATLRRALCSLLVKGSVKVIGAETGEVLVQNTGRREAIIVNESTGAEVGIAKGVTQAL
ncbi:MAG TPA: hypothetical protein DIU35_16650 [Candidatus Latescibacteria bacterium]|nr:hypothetical protein [Candidatus Latescibacterota bacterium]